jgi:S-formylglutathione hydrolase FrmB
VWELKGDPGELPFSVVAGPGRLAELHGDQGQADRCSPAGIALSLRQQKEYDHSYYFISKFMPDDVAWHAQRLRRG